MKKFQGRSIIALVVSIIFMTSRQCNYPRNFKEIIKKLKLAREEKNESMRCITSLKDVITNSSENSVSSNILGLVRQYCDNLKLKEEVIKVTLEIAEKICEKGLIEGRLPNTVAAASVFYANSQLNHRVDLDFLECLSNVSNTYKNTISTAYSNLIKNCGLKLQTPSTLKVSLR